MDEQEVSKFEALEPLLQESDGAWGQVARTAEALFGGTVAVVAVNVRRVDVVLGQVGLPEALAVSGGFDVALSPVRLAARGDVAVVDERRARAEGLVPWMREARCGSLLVAPLGLGGGVGGALVLGFPAGVEAAAPWMRDGLQRLAMDTTPKLEGWSQAQRGARISGRTRIDPGGASGALRGSARRLLQTIQRLAVATGHLRRELAERSLTAAIRGGAAWVALEDAEQACQDMQKRFGTLLARWPSAELSRARGWMLSVACGLAELRPLVRLGRALAAERLDRAQAEGALRLLPTTQSEHVLPLVASELGAWAERLSSASIAQAHA